jgi:hypothetical protein
MTTVDTQPEQDVQGANKILPKVYFASWITHEDGHAICAQWTESADKLVDNTDAELGVYFRQEIRAAIQMASADPAAFRLTPEYETAPEATSDDVAAMIAMMFGLDPTGVAEDSADDAETAEPHDPDVVGADEES